MTLGKSSPWGLDCDTPAAREVLHSRLLVWHMGRGPMGESLIAALPSLFAPPLPRRVPLASTPSFFPPPACDR